MADPFMAVMRRTLQRVWQVIIPVFGAAFLAQAIVGATAAVAGMHATEGMRIIGALVGAAGALLLLWPKEGK